MRKPWDPILLGVLLIGTAIIIKRWLAAGANGQRYGYTTGESSQVIGVSLMSSRRCRLQCNRTFPPLLNRRRNRISAAAAPAARERAALSESLITLTKFRPARDNVCPPRLLSVIRGGYARGALTMTARHLGIVLFLITASSIAFAQTQTPEPPPRIYTGNFGGGLALTNGNTSTRNFNLTGALIRDPKTKSIIKTRSYLRGTTSDVLSVDRTAINLRHEYSLSKQTFIFDQLDYVRDQFKEIIFFWAPTAGVGYKLINTDATQFILDGGGGGVLEKNPGINSKKAEALQGTSAFNENCRQPQLLRKACRPFRKRMISVITCRISRSA